MQSKKRIILKTISWRILAIVLTFITTYIITRNAALATSLALADIVLKTIIYFAHESIWEKISWGKHIHKHNTKENK